MTMRHERGRNKATNRASLSPTYTQQFSASTAYIRMTCITVTEEFYVLAHYTNSIYYAGVQSTAQVHRYLE